MLLGRTLSRTWLAVRKPRSVAIGRVCTPAEQRGARALVVEDVRIAVEDDLLAVARLREHGDQVALGAGGDEERRFLAREAGRQLLEALDGRVFLPHVVADLGARHGLAHGRRRQRQRVGAEIHDVVHG